MKYVTLTEVQAFDVFMEYVTSTAVVLSMIISLALNTSLMGKLVLSVLAFCQIWSVFRMKKTLDVTFDVTFKGKSKKATPGPWRPPSMTSKSTKAWF